MRTQLPFPAAVALLAAERGVPARELVPTVHDVQSQDVQHTRVALGLPPGYFVEERIEFILDVVRRDPTARDLVYGMLSGVGELEASTTPVAPIGFLRLAVLVTVAVTPLLEALDREVGALLQAHSYRLVHALVTDSVTDALEAASGVVAAFFEEADDVPTSAVVIVLSDAERVEPAILIDLPDVEVVTYGPDVTVAELLAEIQR